jgi:soluble lytic murein transglycosylase-like protein
MTKTLLENWALKYFVPTVFSLYLLFNPKVRWSTPEKGKEFEPLFEKYTKAYGLPEGLLSRVAKQESNYNPMAVSPAGAEGLMQFMPATAREWGVDSFDPESAIHGAARYFEWLFDQTNSWPLALAAYNWGIGNIQRKGFNAAPAETKKYVADITADLGGFS